MVLLRSVFRESLGAHDVLRRPPPALTCRGCVRDRETTRSNAPSGDRLSVTLVMPSWRGRAKGSMLWETGSVWVAVVALVVSAAVSLGVHPAQATERPFGGVTMLTATGRLPVGEPAAVELVAHHSQPSINWGLVI